MSLLDEITSAIERAYEALDHRLGWRFLYTPAGTIANKRRLLFIGLNPGGSTYHPPAPSVEEGNAYRLEPWGNDGSLNPLQVQVCALYERISRHLPDVTCEQLMDDSPSANFCPFRSPSWASLANQAESVRFSRALWRRVLEKLSPSAIVCMTDLPARHLLDLYEEANWTLENRTSERVGWGGVTYSATDVKRGAENCLIVRLPHLSRFRIVGRPQSEMAVEATAQGIAQQLASAA